MSAVPAALYGIAFNELTSPLTQQQKFSIILCAVTRWMFPLKDFISDVIS